MRFPTRHIPINETLNQLLQSLPRHIKSDYVFCDKDGKPYGEIRRSFNTALRKAGIEDFRFHDLRHTFASRLIRCSRIVLSQASDPIIQTQERALSITGIGFAFSFLFFILSLALIPLNERFAMFMIPKTFTYMVAFFYLIKGVILSTSKA